MGLSVWAGPASGPAYDRWMLYTAAFATVECRQKTVRMRLMRAGVDFFQACDEARRLHPYPVLDAPEAELASLRDAYRAARDEYDRENPEP